MQTQENNMVMEENADIMKLSQISMENTEGTTKGMETKIHYAGFFVRLAAACMDGLIVGVLLLAVRFPMWINWLSGSSSPLDTQVLFEFTIWDIIIYLLTSLYYVFLTYHSGATIGKKLLQIKVISMDGEKLSFMDIFYRETIGKFLCTVTMNMGYIFIGLDKEKRGFHDMLSDTRVVYNLETAEKKKKKTSMIQPSNYGYIPESQKNAAQNDTVENDMVENDVMENGGSF